MMMGHLLLLLSLLQPAAGTQRLVRMVEGRLVARATLEKSHLKVSGTVEGSNRRLTAAYTLAPNGHLVTYQRELRSLKPGYLVSRVSLKEIRRGYEFKEESLKGSRRLLLAIAPVFLVRDTAWPEGLLPLLLTHTRGYLRFLELDTLEADLAAIRPRGERGRFIGFPGGGVTLELDAAGGLKRLVLPGAARIEIRPRGSSVRSQEALPVGVRETPVTFTSGRARLSGIYCAPAAERQVPPFAAVVLLPDAGPRDRDGNGPASGSGLLKKLAHGLALGGYVSLRWDKRGSYKSTGESLGLAGLTRDILAAAAFLKKDKQVAGSKLALLGHGEGGMVAAALAASHPKLFQAVITLGAPAQPLLQSLGARLVDQLRAEGGSMESVQRQVRAFQKDLETLKKLPADQDPGPGRRLLRDLLQIDPVASFQKLKVPFLVLYGRDDALVPPGHRSLLRAALGLIGTLDFSFQTLVRTDHEFLLIPAERDPEAGGEADVARPLSPALLPFVTDFLKRSLGGKANEK